MSTGNFCISKVIKACDLALKAIYDDRDRRLNNATNRYNNSFRVKYFTFLFPKKTPKEYLNSLEPMGCLSFYVRFAHSKQECEVIELKNFCMQLKLDGEKFVSLNQNDYANIGSYMDEKQEQTQ